MCHFTGDTGGKPASRAAGPGAVSYTRLCTSLPVALSAGSSIWPLLSCLLGTQCPWKPFWETPAYPLLGPSALSSSPQPSSCSSSSLPTFPPASEGSGGNPPLPFMPPLCHSLPVGHSAPGHWAPCYSSKTPRTPASQGLCTHSYPLPAECPSLLRPMRLTPVSSTQRGPSGDPA